MRVKGSSVGGGVEADSHYSVPSQRAERGRCPLRRKAEVWCDVLCHEASFTPHPIVPPDCFPDLSQRG